MNWPFPHFASLVSLLVLLGWGMAASAQSSALIFERTKLRIDTATSDEKEAPVTYDVELRPEDSLRLEYIHTLNALTPTTGVLIALGSPAMVPVPAMKVYTPVDVLFIADDGTVVQIAPNVVMGEVTQAIEAKHPVKALLFLKAGESATRKLAPRRSIVAAKIFTPAPNVQE